MAPNGGIGSNVRGFGQPIKKPTKKKTKRRDSEDEDDKPKAKILMDGRFVTEASVQNSTGRTLPQGHDPGRPALSMLRDLASDRQKRSTAGCVTDPHASESPVVKSESEGSESKVEEPALAAGKPKSTSKSKVGPKPKSKSQAQQKKQKKQKIEEQHTDGDDSSAEDTAEKQPTRTTRAGRKRKQAGEDNEELESALAQSTATNTRGAIRKKDTRESPPTCTSNQPVKDEYDGGSAQAGDVPNSNKGVGSTLETTSTDASLAIADAPTNVPDDVENSEDDGRPALKRAKKSHDRASVIVAGRVELDGGWIVRRYSQDSKEERLELFKPVEQGGSQE